MNRPFAIVGAPSSIGIRPYDEGGIRRLDLAPGVLREQGLGARLAARDHGDVVPPPRGRARSGRAAGRGLSGARRARTRRIGGAAGTGPRGLEPVRALIHSPP